MNWTGGRLQRHSTTTVSTKDRQKQHFAKIRQNPDHQIQKTCPIKFSFSCFDAKNCSPTSCSSLTITGPHNALKCSDPSFNKSLQLSQTKIQAKRRHQMCGTEVLLGSSTKRENEGVSNANLPHRTPTLNSEIKLSTCKSADKTLSEHQNALDEPASKKQKILNMPDWIGVGMTRPSPINCASSTRYNYDECRFFDDIGQYAQNDHSTTLNSKKDFSLIRNENSYSISNIDDVSTKETVLEKKKKSQTMPCKSSTFPDVVFASSTICLEHPIPLSSKISCLIKAKSTNEMNKDIEIASLDLGSTQTKSPDKKLTPLSSIVNQNFYGHQEFLRPKNTSISHFSQKRDFRGYNYKIQVKEYDQEPKVRNEGESTVIQSESNLDNSSSIALPEARFIQNSEPKLPCYRMTKKVRLKEMQTYQPPTKISSIRQEDLKAKRKDPDDVWKDFVFGAYLNEPTSSKMEFS